MPAKSHVDFGLFIQILEVDEDRIPENMKEILRSNKPDRLQSLNQALQDDARRFFVNDQTWLHESIHIAQSLIYPFLYLNSITILNYVIGTFSDKSLLNLKLSGAAEMGAPALNLLDVEQYFWTIPGPKSGDPNFDIALSPYPEMPRPDAQLELRLNAIDLAENAASLMQYKIFAGIDYPSWSQFDRWSKRNPSYTGIINFVGRFLGDRELALRIFLPLVQVAFETNQPVRGFVTLLSAFCYNRRRGQYEDFIAAKEPVPWMGLFDRYLEGKLDPFPDVIDPLSQKFFRIPRNTGELLVGGEQRHPIMGKFAERWTKLLNQEPEYRYAFTAPNGYRGYLEKILDVFTAPISLLKLTVDGKTTVAVTGDINSLGLASFIHSDRQIRDMLADILAVYGYVRRILGALMDTDFRFCHHNDCPLYEQNLCNMWIFVPAVYESCTFQSRIERIRARWGT
jgi:hypothetical protein